MRRGDSSSPRSNPDSRQYQLPQHPLPSGSHPAPPPPPPTGSESHLPLGQLPLDPSDPSSSSSFGPDRPMTAVRAASSSESLIGPSARRYQPYLSSLNTDRRTWAVPQYAASGAAAASGLALESPLSAGDSPSLTSQMTSVAYSAAGQQAPSYESAPASGAVTGYFYSNVPRGSSTYPSSGGVASVDYASQPRALANYIPAPTYGVASPPEPAAAYPPSSSYPRRHTVSAFHQAASAFPSSQVDLEDAMVKEEKRRRNKESSQRFRDRTRERQREKQERLDYLERRVKDLEVQVKAARAGPSGGISPPMGQSGSGDKESVQGALQRLQKENEGLRSALKTAEQEIVRLRPLVGGGAVFPSHPQMYHQSAGGKLSPDSGSYSQTPSPIGHAESSSSYFARGMPGPGPPEGYAPIPPHPGRMQVDYPFSDTRAEASSAEAHHSGQQPLQPQPVHPTSHSAIMGWAEGTHHHDPSTTIPDWEKGLPGRSDPGPSGSQ